MSPFPTWLVAMTPVNPWTAETFADLYQIFTRDFKVSRPIFEGKEIWFFSATEDGVEEIFWHLTHREDKEAGERLPDLRRSERLPWVRCMIEHCGLPELLVWDFEESNGKVHTYVWLRDHDFVIIMKKYPNGERRLVTSYYVDFASKKRSFERKYRRCLGE